MTCGDHRGTLLSAGMSLSLGYFLPWREEGAASGLWDTGLWDTDGRGRMP